MHYNAFDFTYGELSFSMAVLDDLGNGYIFTNIHNRDDARCYCKRILNGESKHPLSDEEKEVLEYAINNEVNYSRTARNTAVKQIKTGCGDDIVENDSHSGCYLSRFPLHFPIIFREKRRGMI